MKTPVGTTFVVAASLLGVAAVAQLVAVLVYFGPGFAGTTAPPPVETHQAAVSPPVQAPAAPAASAPPAAAADASQARFAELMKEAGKLEGGSSPGDALVPLEEALALQPRNPEILARMGSLYERLGQNELAEDMWKNLLELGPDGGRFLDVAEIRLRLLRQQGAGAPTAAGGLALRDQVGLQPGSSLGVVDLKVTDSKGPGASALKNLRLAVKARPGEEIDARDVRINVTFYEMLNGEIVPTTSRVESSWFTMPVDWKDDGLEILEVKYEVPKMGPDGGPAPKFYGYMVNIYNKGQLQETRADPVDLQELYPPPLNEGQESDAPAERGGRAR